MAHFSKDSWALHKIFNRDATIAEIAAAEKINESYVGRVLRLTLLSPDIVEAILAKYAVLGVVPLALLLVRPVAAAQPSLPLPQSSPETSAGPTSAPGTRSSTSPSATNPATPFTAPW